MKSIIAEHKQGKNVGICSVCSAHPIVIEAALRFDLDSNKKVLIEATSNQVNQFGGYTGMKPIDFREFVYAIAEKVGFPRSRLILGGDHLGPNCWQDESAEQAMSKSEVLIAEYVKAGFTKIHLDASMPCKGDPVPLAPSTVAERAARLCAVAERVATDEQKSLLSYVIGTEVPVPGGESHEIGSVHVTLPQDAHQTIVTHEAAFRAKGLDSALSRVIAMVVQPGVEFDHSNVIHYQPEKARALSEFIEQTDLVYEAHSTDYQTADAFSQLVRDHFAILKVGPALTFALREAIFGLSMIEKELVIAEKQSRVIDVIDTVMQDQPEYWKKYYHQVHSKSMIDIHFSLSDRMRYYWPQERINAAVTRLMENLKEVTIPLGMLSQYFPQQFQRILTKRCSADPMSLVIDKIQDVLRAYAYGCDAEKS
ncbi:tagatose-bisphosphate aldolase subunit GatZ [Budvicia diplopodorum]|uniref:tagatose-bisphosphate aldolase subunit GatZ n=1 Tax=Budvicia diplopodorum TaxID=1119056 RepID=UPI00135AAF13|nr:tagatose-bisphosphate aldolase subunit GatZ [Budvicia diplopodorum]